MGTGITGFLKGPEFGFLGNRRTLAKEVPSHGITLQEVGVFSYSVYFLSKSNSMASL